MELPQGATVAVADGQKLSLFVNEGDAANPKLAAQPNVAVNTDNKSGGMGHSSSSANPDDDTQDEDGFSAGVVAILNKHAVEGKLKHLVVVAAPRALGEMRKHYHAKLKDVLVGEISKDLTGHTSAEIEKAIAAA
ncbi:host attachment protein [Aurantimonas sp. Leaf443]|uniref:baeRF12 domain-containing protein n=1 Tax=Aurantimonas sp. Leaf443 TaxID=1736378 RepID=UPI0006F1E8B0|nr:host attachment protein [Aurantimonas sp. Leaf443]KQT84139.1 host cell attachment protein [Aurantimonas sp. Leaf443]